MRYRCLRGATDPLALAVCCSLVLVGLLEQVEDELLGVTEVVDGGRNLSTTRAALKTSDLFEDDAGEVVVVPAADTLSGGDPLCVELLSKGGLVTPGTQACAVFAQHEPHVILNSQFQGILWEVLLQPLNEPLYLHSS